MSENHQKLSEARVSTEDQSADLQREALKKAGCFEICEEKISGKAAQRLEWEHCRRVLRPGDTLPVWRLDRVGRSLPLYLSSSKLMRIVTDLEQRGIAFESLTEKIETNRATGKLVFHMFAAQAEFERNLIRERTRAGLSAARDAAGKGGETRACELGGETDSGDLGLMV